MQREGRLPIWKEIGIEAFILDNLEENIPRGRIIDKLIRRFSLSREDAERCYRRVLDNAVL